MGKKKKTQVFVLKPWCWYCEREFEDEKVLLQHQKSKHFKCQLCPRKLNTAGGLMVHSQQVHKTEPEPLTNTLPGRDGFEIEIFGMEGVPTNALAEWKARKEQEAGVAALAAAAQAKRPRYQYNAIPEADLMAALEQHKALMTARRNGAIPPASVPAMPPPTLPVPPAGMPPPTLPPGMPPFPGAFVPSAASAPTTTSGPGTPIGPDVMPPQNGVFWPDNNATPAEKRAQLPKYRYTSPGPEERGQKRKAAADFL
ncbi:zinc finger protein [Trichosporon asahii var. asahii CBS 8904]|uniref:Zinc finger protein n=1 Tax=Trichosporon asahii var. asahii (strain CBS 8904) TaxID=1220162 RepID=K1VHG4_TRIAC|nr:zinc finger protein [Trichosporon asahii var. asahii CBS 8904]